jgi:hypothetical protein
MQKKTYRRDVASVDNLVLTLLTLLTREQVDGLVLCLASRLNGDVDQIFTEWMMVSTSTK